MSPRTRVVVFEAGTAPRQAVCTNRSGGTNAGQGALVGAASGAWLGALVGFGVLVEVIPVIGPVLAVGTLGVVLWNAAGGAVVIGLVGGLLGSGVSEGGAKSTALAPCPVPNPGEFSSASISRGPGPTDLHLPARPSHLLRQQRLQVEPAGEHSQLPAGVP